MSPRYQILGASLLFVCLYGCATLEQLPPALPEERMPLGAHEIPMDLLPEEELSVPLTTVTVPELIEMRETTSTHLNYKQLRKHQRQRPPQSSRPTLLGRAASTSPVESIQRVTFEPQGRSAKPTMPHADANLVEEILTKQRPRKDEAPEAVLSAMNRGSLVKPRKEWAKNGIMQFPYAVGHTYLIPVHVDRPTVLFLPPGEKLADELILEEKKFNIRYVNNFARTANQKIQAILVKGMGMMSTATTPILTESGLAWWVQLEEVPDDKPSLRGVTWMVDDSIEPVQEGMEAGRELLPLPGIPTVNLDRLHQSYTIEITKGTPPWVPAAVFDDGERTFIKFAESPSFGNVPAVFSVHSDGTPGVVEWVPYEVPGNPDKPSYYVVNQIWPRLLLKGTDGMTVTITRGPTRRVLATQQAGAH